MLQKVRLSASAILVSFVRGQKDVQNADEIRSMFRGIPEKIPVDGQNGFLQSSDAPQHAIFAFEGQDQQQLSTDAVGTYPCIFKIDSKFYDFTPFKLATQKETEGYAQAVASETQLTYTFGFCQLLNQIAESPCQGTYYAAANSITDPQPTCTPYSGSSTDNIDAVAIPAQDVTLADGSIAAGLTGVTLSYDMGAVCAADASKRYSFNINVFCSDTIEMDYSGYADVTDPCAPVVQLVSTYGCDTLDVSDLWSYLSEYEDYFGVFFITGGVLLCFFGLRLIAPSICLAGFLTSVAVALFLFYAVYLNASTTTEEEFWYWLGGGAVVGIVGGLLLAKYVKLIGALVLAAWGGFTGGLILYEALLFHIGYDWILWVSMVICGAGAAFAAWKSYEVVMILTTASLGSYSIIRGVSMYAGHYYNEFTITKMLQDGLLEDIDPWYWAYVGGFVVLIIAGFLIQRKMLNDSKKK